MLTVRVNRSSEDVDVDVDGQLGRSELNDMYRGVGERVTM